uniref:RING-type domain-containing protein n=1 Tax=Globodera pallida TaxID=36090 RepID=A0A183BUX4_GLOPA
MNAYRHRVLIQAAIQDETPYQDSLGHNATVIVHLREWADECTVCKGGEANFYSCNCGHVCLCDACDVNLVIHLRDLRCIICRKTANSSPR